MHCEAEPRRARCASGMMAGSRNCPWREASIDSFGITDAVRVACVLDFLPLRLRIIGIEGKDCEGEADLTLEARRAVKQVAHQINVPARPAATTAPLPVVR